MKQENESLSKHRHESQADLEASRAELEDVKKFTKEAHAGESIDQMQKDLDASREAERYAKSQLEACQHVLKRCREEDNNLKEENKKQVEEVESLKTQLAQTREENPKLKGGMFYKQSSHLELIQFLVC